MTDGLETLTSHWEQIVMAIGAIGIAAESLLIALASLAWTLKKVSDWGYSLAMITSTSIDDSIFWRSSRILEVAARGLESAAARIPRLRTGPRAEKRPGPGTGAILGLMIGALAVSGCGGKAERATRTALASAAHALVSADAIGAGAIDARADECFDEHETRAGWDECMSSAFRYERALRVTAGALRAAEHAVDASGMDGWQSVAPCVLEAALDLLEAAHALGLRMPDEIETLIGVAEVFAEGKCEVTK